MGLVSPLMSQNSTYLGKMAHGDSRSLATIEEMHRPHQHLSHSHWNNKTWCKVVHWLFKPLFNKMNSFNSHYPNIYSLVLKTLLFNKLLCNKPQATDFSGPLLIQGLERSSQAHLPKENIFLCTQRLIVLALNSHLFFDESHKID